jgi:NadR type nicotinamide-nucleotide adenylyltransferase
MPTKKVVIIGPESTGKSTLTVALANALNAPYVLEYAREYIENLNKEYVYEDLLWIAKGQIQAEEIVLQINPPLLIIDTNLHVIDVWSQHKFGKTDPWIKEQILYRNYDLYLLTDIDIPWTFDPQREHPDPEMRHYFFNKYFKILEHSGVPFGIISGTEEERLIQSLNLLRDYKL